MSLQASVHYYANGGIVTKPIPVPFYKGRERSQSPNERHNRRSESPNERHVNRLNPIKVDIRNPVAKIGIFPDPMKPKLMRNGGRVCTCVNKCHCRKGMNVNEMHNMVMGRHIPYATPVGSIHFEHGGKVPDTPATKTVLAEIPTAGVDKVPALLQSGEIVIPKKYATKVNNMMKKAGIYLPNC